MRTIPELRDACAALPGSAETFPFGLDTLVFEVGGKMYCLVGLENDPPRVNLKCDPTWALALRQRWPERVLPGWHMNKKHWNTVVLDGGLPDDLVAELLEHSWERVVAGLPKRERDALRPG